MHFAGLTVVILAGAANIYAAINDFTRPAWLRDNMTKLGVAERWLPTLGILKALGGVGVLAGILIPVIGVAAAAGLVLFFAGAIVVVLRSRWYAHMPFPAVWLTLALAALIMRLRQL